MTWTVAVKALEQSQSLAYGQPSGEVRMETDEQWDLGRFFSNHHSRLSP